MGRPKLKGIRSFAMNNETLAELREVATGCGVPASAIVENATASWLRKYRLDPKGWLAERGLAVASEPADDEI